MRVKPNLRRDSRTTELEFWGEKWHVTYSRDKSGAIKEVFINGPKVGSALADLARASGVVLSLAFQYGSTPKEVRLACPRLADGKPAELIGAVCQVLQREPNDYSAVQRSQSPEKQR